MIRYVAGIWLAMILVFPVKAQTTRPAVFYGANGQWADSLLASMSMDEKIGQLFMVAAYSNKGLDHEKSILNLIKKHHIGGLIFMQGGPYRQARLTNAFQNASKFPLLIAMDAEWGLSMRLDSTFAFPWNLTLGAITDNDLIYEIGREMGRHCRRLGVHVSFAPVVDINTNPENPIINARSFGEDPENVASKGLALMRGLQDEHVLACAKHFPGHGDTDTDSHLTLPRVGGDRMRLDSVELYPYDRLIRNGLGSLMSAHLSVPALEPDHIPTSVSEKVLRNLLREQYGFSGLIFTDALNMKGITKLFPPGEADLRAFMAGNDVLLFAEDVPRAIQMFKKALKDGSITEAQINQSVRRILMTKEWVGLKSKKPVPTKCLADDLFDVKGRLLKRKAYESALTLLKNVNKTLPIQHLSDKKIALVTAGNDQNMYFHRGLKHYQPVDYFSLNENNADEILKQLTGYDKVILALYTSNVNPWKSFKYSAYIKKFAGNLGLQNTYVLTVFGNPYGLRDFPQAKSASAVLMGYQNDVDAAEVAAQIIYGAKVAKGKLPVSCGADWPVNLGLSSLSNGRLQYGLPEEVGLDSKKLAKIDKLVKDAIADKAMPGAQVLVAKNGVVVYEKAFGHHTYEKKKPVDVFDLYDIASITKIASTVPALMYLADRGMFNLDGKLGDHLDLVKGSNKEDLSIRDILSHQSGLHSWIPFYIKTLEEGKWKSSYYHKERTYKFNRQVAEEMFTPVGVRDSILEMINGSKIKPEQGYKYSDLGYYYFQLIVENAMRMTLDQFVESYFFKPIGAHRLRYHPLKHFDLDEIVPTEKDTVFRKQLLHGHVHDQGAAMMGGVAGHAGLFSNANDLAKLMQMYLNRGTYGGHAFIDSLTLLEFTRCQFCEENENRRGAGFDKPQLKGSGPTCGCLSMDSYGHSGFTGTLAWVDPDEEIVYIFLSNRVHPDAENTKLLKRSTRTLIQELIYEAIMDKEN
ncbi:MAG: serine hydrolase [Cryomorphaceae bacterium]|nr:serine hydrolase [Cryomorphaceae bacterium]